MATINKITLFFLSLILLSCVYTSPTGETPGETTVKAVLETPALPGAVKRYAPGETLLFGIKTEPNGSSTYTWDFGDGSPLIRGTSPEHSYEETGPYRVVVTMENADGSRSIDFLELVINTPPLAVIRPAKTLPPVIPESENDTILLVGDESHDLEGDLSAYRWDVGNQCYQEGFLEPGETIPPFAWQANLSEVTLTVTDGDGSTSSCRFSKEDFFVL